jgi:hypothetical protein
VTVTASAQWSADHLTGTITIFPYRVHLHVASCAVPSVRVTHFVQTSN